MTLDILCNLLEIPEVVINEINNYKKTHTCIIDENLQHQLKERNLWESAITEIQHRIGEDPFGFYILAELLDCGCKTYKEYEKIGIDSSVFIQTMKFCTRFLEEHKKIYGFYSFTWGWWFPRQLALQEFRIGELEYEFADNKTKQIYIHIPSDANLKPQCVQESFSEYRKFLHTYYPQWENVPWYCESWMLSPTLNQLLPETSNILSFQKLFRIENIDYDSMAVLDWVYPGQKAALTELSENTSLQRNMKKFLLDGHKVGWAMGKIK